MAFIFAINQQAAKQIGTGGALSSGVHAVLINEAWLGTTKNGNNTIDLEFTDKDGAKATVYGMCIDEKFTSGAANSSFGVWNELAIVTSMQTGQTAIIERTMYGGEKVNQESFVELVGKSIMIGLQIVFDVNKDGTKESKKRSLYRAFYANGLSISEVQAGETVPKQSVNLANTIKDYQTEKWKVLQATGPTNAIPQVPAAIPIAPVAPVAPVQPAPVQQAVPAQVVPVQPAQPAPVETIAPQAVPAPVQPQVMQGQVMPQSQAAPIPVQVQPAQPAQAAPVQQALNVAQTMPAGGASALAGLL